MTDRETGKLKGYGFCEYRDEETALSARRNLQGYKINGRKLRVDFAGNDKNSDRNREQVRYLDTLNHFMSVSKNYFGIFLSLAVLLVSCHWFEQLLSYLFHARWCWYYSRFCGRKILLSRYPILTSLVFILVKDREIWCFLLQTL